MNISMVGTTMTVRVLLFAQLRDHFGADELTGSLPVGATGADVMAWLSRRSPPVKELLSVSRLAVNCEYAALDRVLRDGDEVVVIPPVSGG